MNQDLVVQAPDVPTRALKELAQMTRARSIEAIDVTAFRLCEAEEHGQVAAYCREARLDYAYVPITQTLSSFGLYVTDMDSTLINIECIDEITDMLDLKTEVAAITASAMRGEIEFSESLTRRVALLEGLEESALTRVYDERLALNPGAERLFKALKQHCIRTMLVTGGFTFFTDRLKQRLGFDYCAANRLETRDGRLTGRVLGDIVDAQGKAAHLKRARDELGLTRDQVIAVGDGANDLKMLAEASISIAYHAKPVVAAQARYAINYVGLDGIIHLFRADRTSD